VKAIDYLTLDDLIEIGTALIPGFKIRDIGLLESAALRPQTTVYGEDAYPEFIDKAAALMHSLARNHCLADGNKRLAWAATRTFCLMNSYDLKLTVDDAEKIVVDTAKGELDVEQLVEQLRNGFGYRVQKNSK
jgi:death-on-curing protein